MEKIASGAAVVVFWAVLLLFVFCHANSYISERVYIFSILYIGFVLAFCFLLFASFIRKSNLARWTLLVLAFFGLLCQGGCYIVLGGIGTATGGSSNAADKMMQPVAGAFLIALIWSFVLVFCFPIKEDAGKIQNPDRVGDKSNKAP